MKNKYLIYKDEIINLFENGNGYQTIANYLINKYNLKVQANSLRVSVKAIVQYLISDKEIIEYNIRLAKQNKKLKI